MFRFSLARFLARAGIVAGVLSPIAGHSVTTNYSFYPTSAPGAQPCTSGGTLADYVTAYGIPGGGSGSNGSGSYVGCTIGLATYYGFSAVGNTPSGSIFVTPTSAAAGAAGLPPGFTFTGPGLASTSNTTFTFEYYVDPPIGILGASMSDLPPTAGSSVSESICVGGVFGFCSSNPSLLINTLQSNDSTTFPATQFIDVLTTVTLAGVDGGAGGVITDFTQTETVRPFGVTDVVPEPPEVALAGLGIVLMGVMRSRRRRK